VARWLFNLNPLWPIGAVVAVQFAAIALGYLPVSLAPTMALVLGLAYAQNTAYGLQSRSANRNSNAYHLLAAVAASFTFFWSLQLLVRNELPPVLLAPYVFATVIGSVHANALSIRIEGALGLSAEGAKGRPQLMKLWPTVAVLSALLAVQAFFLAPSYGSGVLAALLVITVVESFAFSMLRVARSTDHYWFHTGAVLVNLGLGFLKFVILVNNQVDWALFLPTTTGSVIGSLIGANLGQDVGKKLKAAFDSHVGTGAKVLWPVRQLVLVLLGLAVHAVVFGIGGAKAALVLLAVSAWQAVSFTMVSRARQRNNAQYLAWTSVFSNGVWYVCLHYLAQGAITAEKAAPYIVGNAAGSLVGQTLAMKAEQATGALMDAPKQDGGVPKAVPA
jgi:hypothetical protein